MTFTTRDSAKNFCNARVGGLGEFGLGEFGQQNFQLYGNKLELNLLKINIHVHNICACDDLRQI